MKDFDDASTYEPIRRKHRQRVPIREIMRCRGKHCHTKKTVQQTRIQAMKHRPDVPLYTYHCRHCKWWHLTKQAQRTKQ